MNPTTESIRATLREYAQMPREQARTLPAAFYTSAEFLEVEKEHLFRKEWVCIGRVEEVPAPGDYTTTDLLGEPLLIIRGEDGEVRVLSNVCRHRGMPVADGRGHNKRFVCPYHAWSYDTTGQLINRPFIEERPGAATQACRLPEFASEVWLGFLYVNLDGNAPALAPRLAPLAALIRNYHIEDMKIRYSKDVVWETNWKCLTENFMEGYHLSPVHQTTLHPINPTSLCKHFPPGDEYFGYYAGYPRELPRLGKYHPDLTEDESYNCVMFCAPPGHVVGVAAEYTTFLCIQPKTVDSLCARVGVIFPDGVSQNYVDEAVELFERTMDEDKEQLLRLRRGLKSRYYMPSPLAPADYEGTIWDFYQYIGRKLDFN